MEATRRAFAEFRAGTKTAQDMYRTMCRDIVENVGSTRASIWTLSPLQDRIVCLSLLDARTGAYSSGSVLSEEDFPEYFHALRKDGVLVAPDACEHPATRCFDEVYFVPNEIRSLLDIVVRDGATPVAVQCCEHCGAIKQWTDSDREYLEGMSSMLSFMVRIIRT